MDLTNLLPLSQVVVFDKNPSDMQDLIEKMAEPLLENLIVSDGQGFVDAVLAREKMMSTAVGSQVCIPHARTIEATRLSLVVGILPEDFDYGWGEEVEQVRVVFLIAISAYAPVSHLKLLQHLAKFTRYAKKVEKLAESKNAKAALKLMHGFKPKA